MIHESEEVVVGYQVCGFDIAAERRSYNQKPQSLRPLRLRAFALDFPSSGKTMLPATIPA
ncbi:MAG TPA: hypothetical protein ENI93_01460 [Gammaproteobacteria bacterium]|nr:hypothetical protein [Gammaproteobacteria bacterium]